MKKSVFGIGVIGALLLMSSCKKDWVCECTVTAGDSSFVTEETIEATTLSKASDECKSKDETTFGSCEIKP